MLVDLEFVDLEPGLGRVLGWSVPTELSGTCEVFQERCLDASIVIVRRTCLGISCVRQEFC